MNKKEAINEYIVPAISRTWNDDRCKEILEALEQEPCDAVSRKAAIDACDQSINVFDATDRIRVLSSVTPAEKVGRWILVQRGKYVDINCSECGFSRIKEFAYNYTVEDISEQEFRDFVEKNKMNFCECCGAKMQEVGE